MIPIPVNVFIFIIALMHFAAMVVYLCKHPPMYLLAAVVFCYAIAGILFSYIRMGG